MKISYLDFEQPIAELESQIEGLQAAHDANDALDISKELTALEKKNKKLSEDIYGNLNAWQISQLARHSQRPYTLDYIQAIFTDFEELHGDRAFADDPAIVGGIARLQLHRGSGRCLEQHCLAQPGVVFLRAGAPGRQSLHAFSR